jgi:trehalose 6-phosphate phosphatase
MKKPDDTFWALVENNEEHVLALDYDGTIARFRTDRMSATPLLGTRELINKIHKTRKTHMAVISGRPMSELEKLLKGVPDDLVMFGSHGWESSLKKKTNEPIIPKALLEKLEEVRAAALTFRKERFSRDIEKRVELKPASVAAHIRGMDASAAEKWISRVRRKWSRMEDDDCKLMEFNGGLEMCISGRDKGDALKELSGAYPGAGLVVYIGDDKTDENAFTALDGQGVGIKVGVKDGATAAHYFLDDCEDVRKFLEVWLETIDKGRKDPHGRTGNE